VLRREAALPLQVRAWSLARRVRRHVDPSAGRLVVRLDGSGDRRRNVMTVSRQPARLRITLSPDSAGRDRVETLARIPVLLHLLSRTAAGFPEVRADFGDGGLGEDGQIGFSASAEGAILVPDPFFFNARGYDLVRRLAQGSQLPWMRRSDILLWRGGSTGHGLNSTTAMNSDDPVLRQRIRLCLKLRALEGTDARIVGIPQTHDRARDEARLRTAGIMGPRVLAESWILRKFAIDIDGNTNAWTNLFTRLLMGCCVLKVESEHGYRQWYYDDLVPWRHFVPIRPDLADLIEKIAWCRANLAACQDIAAAGQTFAMARTWESEVAGAIARLDEVLAERRP
jgi:hypothetical protein